MKSAQALPEPQERGGKNRQYTVVKVLEEGIRGGRTEGFSKDQTCKPASLKKQKKKKERICHFLEGSNVEGVGPSMKGSN